MLEAEPVCLCGGGAIGCLASFESGSTVLEAEPACVCVSGAARMHAHRPCIATTVLVAESPYVCFGGAAWMDTHTSCTPTVLDAESSCL